MIRGPPISTRTDTLFPYTTLVRSGAAAHVPLGQERCRLRQARTGAAPPGTAAAQLDVVGDAQRHRQRTVVTVGGDVGDACGMAVARMPRTQHPVVPAHAAAVGGGPRSEERRVGKEWVSPGRSRG